jgi:uncharacterized protein (TIGR03066 family)
MIAPPSDESTPPAPPPPADGNTPSIDANKLVGTWTAGNEQQGRFQMELTATGEFTWTYSSGGTKQELKGVYAVKDDGLVLEPDEGGTLVARVALQDDQTLSFRVVGSQEGDPGLNFKRS